MPEKQEITPGEMEKTFHGLTQPMVSIYTKHTDSHSQWCRSIQNIRTHTTNGVDLYKTRTHIANGVDLYKTYGLTQPMVSIYTKHTDSHSQWCRSIQNIRTHTANGGSFWCLILSSQFFYIFKTVYTYSSYYIQSSIIFHFSIMLSFLCFIFTVYEYSIHCVQRF